MIASEFPLPNAEFMRQVGSSADDFHKIGARVFQMVRDKCGVLRHHRVLDIGSGCGRVAIHFADYLSEGRYDGLDIVLPMVKWCRENISSRVHNFHFHHADLANILYNPRGMDASSYVFPFADDTFDVAFAASVFTHLLPNSAEQYAREIARVLKQGRKALLSWYIINDEFRRQRANEDKLGVSFRFDRDDHSLYDERRPEAVIAFEEWRARGLIEAAGLRIEELSYGSWRKPGGLGFQDWILVEKHR